MQITAQTTDKQLRAGVASAKKALADAVLSSSDAVNHSVDLAKLVNSLAAAEGRAYVRAMIRDGLAQWATPDAIKYGILRLALSNPDDTWSGRANDVRRAYADGVREEVRDQMYRIGA